MKEERENKVNKLQENFETQFNKLKIENTVNDNENLDLKLSKKKPLMPLGNLKTNNLDSEKNSKLNKLGPLNTLNPLKPS